MRMLMNVKFPTPEFNDFVKDGTAGKKLNQILEEIKPTEVYFTEQNGLRSALLIFNVDDPSKIPAFSEPWFLIFNASVEMRIVMSPDDLKKAGLEELGRKWA